MASEMTQRQRAEAMVGKYEAWVKEQPAYMQMPTLREKDKLTELFTTVRQEALREALLLSIGREMPEWQALMQGLIDPPHELDRLAREGREG